ncbi:MAG: hypothetical protein U0575_06270 [Phycisphaerales bacterium]
MYAATDGGGSSITVALRRRGHGGPERAIVVGQERDRLADAAAPLEPVRRAADAVDVLLGSDHHVVVDHGSDGRHVQAAGGDVGRHEDAMLAARERAERSLALGVRTIAVQESDGHAVTAQRRSDPVRPSTRAAEDQDAGALRKGGLVAALSGDAGAGQERPQQRHLELLGDPYRALRDVSHRRVGRIDIEPHRMAHEIVGQPRHRLGHRGAEEQRLSIARNRREDRSHLRLEAEVEHPIRLVQHDMPEAREVEAAAIEQFLAPARRRDDQVHAVGERRGLCAMATLPCTQSTRSTEPLTRFVASSATCTASSRVGQSTSDRGFCPARAVRRRRLSPSGRAPSSAPPAARPPWARGATTRPAAG